MIADIKNLFDLLSSSAAEYPNRIAVKHNDHSVNYSQLLDKSLLIAEELTKLGLPDGFRAGLLMPKSISSVAIIFGILRAEGAYVPLDFEAPPERTNFIAADCELSILFLPKGEELPGLAQSYINYKRVVFTNFNFDILLFDDFEKRTPSPAGLAYLLYTSGSTGKPKGVMFSHKNGLSFINWCSEFFEVDEESIMSSHAPFHFDLSIFDLYVSIKHGACLVLIDSSTGKNPRALSHLIEEKKITHWYSTPTILKLMLHYGKIQRFNHSTLKYVLFAGEVFPVKPLKQLTDQWSHARFYNLYGPTETNVCTWFEIPLPVSESQTQPFPIGVTCSHLKSKLVSHGNTGNVLCVSGPSVCIGYWKDDVKMEDSTFYDKGKRWYYTGDLVTVNKNGEYVFRGRVDRMVKRKGFRIELGEIENTLHRMPKVADAAAISTENDKSEVLIKVFVQKKKWAELNSIDLKQFCLKYLPHYMVPDEFICIPNLPKTSTDKTDYQALDLYNQ